MKLLTTGLTDIDSFMNKETRREGVKLIANYYNITSVRQSVSHHSQH